MPVLRVAFDILKKEISSHFYSNNFFSVGSIFIIRDYEAFNHTGILRAEILRNLIVTYIYINTLENSSVLSGLPSSILL